MASAQSFTVTPSRYQEWVYPVNGKAPIIRLRTPDFRLPAREAGICVCDNFGQLAFVDSECRHRTMRRVGTRALPSPCQGVERNESPFVCGESRFSCAAKAAFRVRAWRRGRQAGRNGATPAGACCLQPGGGPMRPDRASGHHHARVRGRASAPHPVNKLRFIRNAANAPFPSSVSETIGIIGVK